MGVRGLLGYVERDCPGAFYEVDLRKQAKAARAKGIEPVIIVDLYNVVRHIYADLDWISGGQFRQYVDHMGQFLDAFYSAGIRLVIVGDGTTQQDKRDVWVKRRYEAVEKDVYPVYNALKQGCYPCSKEMKMPNVQSKLVLRYVFNHEVTTSLREADDEIALLARKHKALGILANDSDYLIYQTGVPMLSIKHLNWETLRTMCYDNCMLARRLGIAVNQLPIFAILAGNDVIDREKLAGFCSNLKITNFNVRFNFPAICNYIAIHLPGPGDNSQILRCVEYIAGSILHNPSYQPIIENALKGYFLDFPEVQYSKSPDKHWSKILNIFRDGYTSSYSPNQYPILIGRPYDSSTVLEDFRESHSIPPNCLLWESTRQRTYGILLKEKPGACVDGQFVISVEEWCMSGIGSLDEANLVVPMAPPHHPGLLYLHTERTPQAQTERWKLFAWAVDPRLDHTKLTGLEPAAVCLVSNLYKLQHERERPVLSNWEVRAFIVQFFLLKTLSEADMNHQRLVTPSPRGAQLANLYARSHVFHINYAVGGAIPMDQTMSLYQLDGQLFQRVYNRGDVTAVQLYKEFHGYQVESGVSQTTIQGLVDDIYHRIE